ncbi:minor capsid protein inhibitor of protease [Enterobacter phage phiEap-3]|uniref:Minor capsid protein inhibitor of protease n=1 Tax=Enterobacter phage phiEap-3 TaxID=1682394 RepID=A0A0K2FI63_9CAUD|nr:minor head protein inhibitor of protease [Enterobacter phage phiEap-3]ALA45331.1 minor capsid protein inhibitor of protease [Enterobacter phage phiEap-3]
MSIDYEKVEGFKALEQKEAKLQLATYAQETFDVKLNRQKSFENMLADLEAAVPAEKPELLIDSPDPEIATYEGEQSVPGVAPEVADQIEIVPDALQAPVSDSETVSDELAWMEGFTPSIIMMGRSVSNTGFYTCPYWIYDWMKQNPDWYKHPDGCPHYSARQTLKSLAWYMHRDGMVTVRETRNSQFDTFKK